MRHNSVPHTQPTVTTVCSTRSSSHCFTATFCQVTFAFDVNAFATALRHTLDLHLLLFPRPVPFLLFFSRNLSCNMTGIRHFTHSFTIIASSALAPRAVLIDTYTGYSFYVINSLCFMQDNCLVIIKIIIGLCYYYLYQNVVTKLIKCLVVQPHAFAAFGFSLCSGRFLWIISAAQIFRLPSLLEDIFLFFVSLHRLGLGGKGIGCGLTSCWPERISLSAVCSPRPFFHFRFGFCENPHRKYAWR